MGKHITAVYVCVCSCACAGKHASVIVTIVICVSCTTVTSNRPFLMQFYFPMNFMDDPCFNFIHSTSTDPTTTANDSINNIYYVHSKSAQHVIG